MKPKITRLEFLFLLLIFTAGVFLRLFPRLNVHPHLITFEADIWYRLCLAQYLLDHQHLPVWDIRYEAYGQVPFWYNPFSLYIFAGLSKLSSLDLPTVCSRILPWIEAACILPFYFLGRYLYNQRVAVVSTLFLTLSPSFIFWTGIADPQSFTLFLIPVIILLWVKFLQKKFLLQNRWAHLVLMGLLMAVNFLIHLTYFNLVIILGLIHLALVIEGQARFRQFLYFLIPVAVSQIVTAWWWAPQNLYWWWTQVLTTSSAFFEGMMFLKQYGLASAVVGHLAFATLIIFIVRRHSSFPAFYLVPVFWALFPMAESHNEGLLKLINRSDWTWVNLAKPLEGFRFYVFLAPPLALGAGLIADQIQQSRFIAQKRFGKYLSSGVAVLLGLVLLTDMLRGYNLFGRFQNASMQIEEIQAAQWFRRNSQPEERILAEYFTAQMFCGINGGKCLEGSMFPLKNVSIPYITEGWRVQQDIYSVYTTNDPISIGEVLERYHCTHVFLSQKSLRHIEHITKGDIVLDDIEGLEHKDFSATLWNPQYFIPVYYDKDIMILKWKGKK